MKTTLRLLALLILSAITLDVAMAGKPLDISIVHLIATPERYQGKLVRVTGFIHAEFEGNALYLHKEDYDHSIHKNGVWIQLPKQLASDKSLSDRYVLVEGVFDGNDMGHMGLWSGTIAAVSRLEPCCRY